MFKNNHNTNNHSSSNRNGSGSGSVNSLHNGSNNISNSKLNSADKIISIFDTYLDVLLTKYFYFSAKVPYQQQIYNSIKQNKFSTSEKHNCYSDNSYGDDSYGDIFDEIDSEPYEGEIDSNSGSKIYNAELCRICYRHGTSLIKICECENMHYCMMCIRKMIFIGICNTLDKDKICGSKKCNMNVLNSCNEKLLLNPQTGRVCDIRMLDYIKRIANIYCSKCGAFKIHYPNANEVIKYGNLLSRLYQINYYQNEYWDPTCNITNDLASKRSRLPSKVPIIKYNSISFRYYTLIDRLPGDDFDPDNINLIYYIDPECTSGTIHINSNSTAVYFNDHLALPKSDLKSGLVCSSDRIIKVPLNDVGRNVFTQWHLQELCMDAIKETALRIPVQLSNSNIDGYNNTNSNSTELAAPIIFGPITKAKIKEWQSIMVKVHNGI